MNDHGYVIRYSGQGDTYFKGVNEHGRACFAGRHEAEVYASFDAGSGALTRIPECVRKWFAVVPK